MWVRQKPRLRATWVWWDTARSPVLTRLSEIGVVIYRATVKTEPWKGHTMRVLLTMRLRTG